MSWHPIFNPHAPLCSDYSHFLLLSSRLWNDQCTLKTNHTVYILITILLHLLIDKIDRKMNGTTLKQHGVKTVSYPSIKQAINLNTNRRMPFWGPMSANLFFDQWFVFAFWALEQDQYTSKGIPSTKFKESKNSGYFFLH